MNTRWALLCCFLEKDDHCAGGGQETRPAVLPLPEAEPQRVTGEEEERCVFSGEPTRTLHTLCIPDPVSYRHTQSLRVAP